MDQASRGDTGASGERGSVVMEIVEVIWLDTMTATGWRRARELDEWLESEGTIHKSTGYLYKITDEWLCLVESYQSGREDYVRNYGHPTQFPIACVVEVRKVKDGRKIKLPEKEVEGAK